MSGRLPDNPQSCHLDEVDFLQSTVNQRGHCMQFLFTSTDNKEMQHYFKMIETNKCTATAFVS